MAVRYMAILCLLLQRHDHFPAIRLSRKAERLRSPIHAVQNRQRRCDRIPQPSGGLPSDWGSGRHGELCGGVDVLEQLAEAGTELAIEDSAVDLEQEGSAAAGAPPLLRFFYSTGGPESGGGFGG